MAAHCGHQKIDFILGYRIFDSEKGLQYLQTPSHMPSSTLKCLQIPFKRHHILWNAVEYLRTPSNIYQWVKIRRNIFLNTFYIFDYLQPLSYTFTYPQIPSNTVWGWWTIIPMLSNAIMYDQILVIAFKRRSMKINMKDQNGSSNWKIRRRWNDVKWKSNSIRF